MTGIKATYIAHMGNDLTVANAARVSFGKTSELEDDAWGPPKLKEKDAKLIRYLAKHSHISSIRTLLRQLPRQGSDLCSTAASQA